MEVKLVVEELVDGTVDVTVEAEEYDVCEEVSTVVDAAEAVDSSDVVFMVGLVLRTDDEDEVVLCRALVVFVNGVEL